MMAKEHGGDIYTFARQMDINLSDVIDLSSNINPLRPLIGVDFNMIDPRPYPDINYKNLKKSIANHYGVLSKNIALFNGASAAIFTLIRELSGDVFLYAPLYSEYMRACRVYGKSVNLINRMKDRLDEPKENSIVVFVNPSTPDGKYHDLDKLMKMWIDKSCTIIVDESFLEFTSYSCVFKDFSKYPKLFVLKSMTKFFSCAGVRVGVLIAQKDAIDMITKTEPSWMISRGDEYYMLAALRDKTFSKRTKEHFKKERNRLLKVLEKAPQIKRVYPSDVNFFMVELIKGWSAKRLAKVCAKENIMIRDCSNFDFLSDCHVRIAVKTKAETKALKRALFA